MTSFVFHKTVNTRSVSDGASTRLAASGTLVGFAPSRPPLSTFLRSLRSTPVTEFPRYYGRSDSSVCGSSGTWSMNTVLLHAEVSLIHASGLPDRSVSKHLTHSRRRFITLPLSATGFPVPLGSGLRLSHAGSSAAPGRIEFVILRTGRSPPAALHHASLRRSCIRLQAGERLPGEDFHLSDYSRFQAHVRKVSDLP